VLLIEKIKKQLRTNKIGFYEINQEFFFPLDFKLNRQGKTNYKNNMIVSKGFRAESVAKLLLYFVANPDALKRNQRQLAHDLDISLGAVNHAIHSLKSMRLLLSSGPTKYLGKFDDLVSRWRHSLFDLQAKELLLGKFSPLNDSFYKEWKKLDLGKINSCWGGEPAAAIRTKYLGPEVYSVFTYNDGMSEILKLLRLKKDPNGKIELYKCFWPASLNNKDNTALILLLIAS